ncbi:uncharacterized protein LOC112095607 [Citrus clementina]|uniref:uncharacterized protein LOC112095607 n=1 Tax=Citrus clementina TaxID=85681 RepID=UPI000CED0168|nr:uncharacterized protein LOC112095607 [Citrus x clementina]
MNGISRKLNFENCFEVDRRGRGGGLAMLWSSEIVVQIKSFSNHHIDAEVQTENGKLFRCNSVYDHPEVGQKKHIWTLLRRLAGLSLLPWLCFGDFNEVLHPYEKTGGNERELSLIRNDREALRDCNLVDMGYKGYPFTWNNGRYGPHYIEERLGRGRGLCWKRKKSTRIHYEDLWSPYEACKEIIKTEWSSYGSWNDANPIPLFQKVVKESMARLLLWSKEEFGEREKKLKQIMNQLERLKQSYVQYDSGEEIKKLEGQIHDILINEEKFWKQRSRAEWLKAGDKNTKYFHYKASSRKKKNRIWGIENGSGSWTDKAEEVEYEFCEYFAKLFTTSQPSQEEISAALEGITPRVSEAMNEQLEQPFTLEDITEALAQMSPTKAPGPDGLPAAFYQKHWNVVKKKVITTCLHILNEQGTMAPLNHTYIALVPKAERQKLIHGLSFGKDINISHLLFADDSLIFIRASPMDCGNLKRIFDSYTTASGQLFNLEKSSMFFSKNTKVEEISAIQNIFQLNVVSRHEKYLGLPSMIGRKRSSFFQDVKLKVMEKISNWQHKFFSSGGKEVLIKAVAQAVPAYAMSVFKVPLGVCDDIQRAIANFWWGSKKEKRYSLVARVLEAKYFKKADFLNAKLGSNPRFIWRSIIWGRQVILAGSRWRIGKGDKVQIYKASWIPRPSTFRPTSWPTLPKNSYVSMLINDDNQWDERKIYCHFDKLDADRIVSMPLPRQPKDDQILWHYDKQGRYSVKSGYQVALRLKFLALPSSSRNTTNQWETILALDLLEKLRIFMWRAETNLLPSMENLWKRKVAQEPVCQICKYGVESIFHALVNCKTARKVWRLTQFAEDLREEAGEDLLSLLKGRLCSRRKVDIELLVAICWGIWSARNQFIFKLKKEDPHIVLAKAEAILKAYKRTHVPAPIHMDQQTWKAQQNWSPPPAGWFKLNVDVATNREKHTSGLGVVIRNAEGIVVAAAINCSKFCGDVAYVEAEAIEFGPQVVGNAKLPFLIVETDSQELS